MALILSIGVVFLSLAAQGSVWIAPDGSDTAGDGSELRPYASIPKALAVSQHAVEDTLFINVREGDYFLESPVCITQGSDRPVVVRAAGGVPRFVGGRLVGGWEKADNGLYRTIIPGGLDFQQFYVNGRRAVPARTPNKGFFKPRSVIESGVVRGEDVFHSMAVLRIGCDDEAFDAIRSIPVSETDGAKVRFYHKWSNTHLRVNLLDRDSCVFYSYAPAQKPWNPIDTNSRYFFYDYMDALDEPGEWYFDRKERYLYYKPLPDEDLSKSECVIPLIEQWIRIKGSEQSHISNIRFENISFGYSSYLIPEGLKGPEQAAASTPAAIELDFADNISFVNCEMRCTGAYAVWIREACSRNLISHCYIADLGAGGVKIGKVKTPQEGEYVTNGNVIDNNIITGGGHVFPCGIGVGILQSSDNRVTHNEICNFRYSGVSVGWVWGYKYSPAKRNVIEFNHIHMIGQGDLSDMGAVYTLAYSEGTRVNNNVIHDVESYDYGGWGLYTDEGSTYVEMRNNLVYNCKSGAFHQHYGRENRIENNIMAYSTLQQLQLTRAEKHTSFTFDRNIVLQDRGQTTRGPWSTAHIDYGRNIFWSETSDLSFGDCPGGFENFRKNIAPGSLNVDPHFNDPHNADFRLKSLKSARAIGFIPFDYSLAGVYGSSDWLHKASVAHLEQ